MWKLWCEKTGEVAGGAAQTEEGGEGASALNHVCCLVKKMNK